MNDLCIWCAQRAGTSLEHIVPDALGCPTEFVLKRGVCTRCNQRNGKLDRALLVPFEIVTVLKGVPRKRGKNPTVDGFSSISSGYDANGPAFYINREKHPILAPNGKWLGAATASDPIKNAKWEERPDGTAQISYEQELRFDRKAVRGLFKIAVEAIAFFEGLDAARLSALDQVKRFILEGAGNFRAIITPDQNPTYESYFAPSFAKDGFDRVVGVTILGVGFVCDFDPNFRGGAMLLAEAKKQSLQAQVIPNWPRDLWQKNNFLFQ